MIKSSVDSIDVKQVLAIHYLPGLRLAIEEMVKLVAELEGVTTGTGIPAILNGQPKGKRQPETYHCPKCSSSVGATGKPFLSQAAVQRHLYVAHTRKGRSQILAAVAASVKAARQ